MRIKETAVFGAILGAAWLVMIATPSSNASDQVGGMSVAQQMASLQIDGIATTPIMASDSVPVAMLSRREHGWGPVRATDW